jgi:hypothetical protein
MPKTKKDSNAPKRPLSAYILFCKDHREAIKSKNPNYKVTDITKALGEMWKNVSDKKKKEYEEKASVDKARYAEEMADYTPPQVDEETPKGKRKEKKEKKDGDKPKRAPSAYILFCQDMRATVKEEYPNYSPTQITSKLGELWRELDDESKAEFSAKSKQSKPEVKSKKEVETKPKKAPSTKKTTKKTVSVRNMESDEEELDESD